MRRDRVVSPEVRGIAGIELEDEAQRLERGLRSAGRKSTPMMRGAAWAIAGNTPTSRAILAALALIALLISVAIT
jgi:hypothetical protein